MSRKNYPKKPKERRENRPFIKREEPTKSERNVLDLFTRLTGVEVRYHEEGHGEKIGIAFGREKDTDPNGDIGEFIKQAGQVEIKEGEHFTPDGRFVYEGEEHALEIKSNLYLGDSQLSLQKLLNIISKYGDHPLVIIAQNLHVGKGRRSPLIKDVNLFGNEKLPAYLIPRTVRGGGSLKSVPVYIINWNKVIGKVGGKKDV